MPGRVRIVYFRRVGSSVRRVGSSGRDLRVVLADDHHFFREGLRGVLEADGIAVVGEASDGFEAIRLADELSPDIVVMDLDMPSYSGIDATRRIAASDGGVQVVVLTVSADDEQVLAVLQAGASSYLLKDAKLDDVVGGIRQAASGQAVLSSQVARALIARVQAAAAAEQRASSLQPSDRPPLTARETEVLRLIVSGADNAAIGRELSISPHTVKQYVANIFEKLEVNGRVQAAVHAVRARLV